MFGELGNLMKLQGEIKKLQKQIKKMESTGTNDDGMVSITINGELECVGVKVDEDKLKTADKRSLEKAIQHALNRAASANKEAAAAKMKEITGGLKIPGMDGLF